MKIQSLINDNIEELPDDEAIPLVECGLFKHVAEPRAIDEPAEPSAPEPDPDDQS